MGIFTEWLYLYSRPEAPKDSSKDAEEKAEEGAVTNVDDDKQEGEDQKSEEMGNPVQYMTLDGEPPNGGVPPDRQFMMAPTPAPSFHPPVNAPQNGDHPPWFVAPTNFGGGSFYPHAPSSQFSSVSSSMTAIPVYFNGVSRPIFPSSNGVTIGAARPEAPAAPPIQIYQHFNSVCPHQTHTESPITTANPTTHSWIKMVLHDVRPWRSYPYAWPGHIEFADKDCWPKSTSMRDFLAELLGHTHQHRNYGVQQLYRSVDGSWGSGRVFAWGEGDERQPIGDTVLGQGIPGREIYLCLWKRD